MPTLREMREALLRAHRAQIALLRQQLDAFDAGMRSGERLGVGPWIDTTERSKDRLREGIAEYESTVAYLEQEIANAARS